MTTCLDKVIPFKVHQDSMADDIATALEGLPEQFHTTTSSIASGAFRALEIFTTDQGIYM